MIPIRHFIIQLVCATSICIVVFQDIFPTSITFEPSVARYSCALKQATPNLSSMKDTETVQKLSMELFSIADCHQSYKPEGAVTGVSHF